MTIAEFMTLVDGLDMDTEIVVNEMPRGNGNEEDAFPVSAGSIGRYFDNGPDTAGKIVSESHHPAPVEVVILSRRT